MKIVIAILIFSIIVIFHEFGHLLLAKKNGIKVVEFSIGLGPTLIGKEIGGTKYSIKLLPFGGACQMLGEDFLADEDSEEAQVKEGSFNSKSVWRRMSVILAGPFFNFILAFVFSLFLIGFAGYDPSLVTGVTAGTPADASGLRKGDEIISINGTRTNVGRQVDMFFMYGDLDSKPLEITYKRDGQKYSTTLVPEKIKKYLLGFTYDGTVGKAEIKSVVEGYPIQAAGLKAGDVIVGYNGIDIVSGQQLSELILKNPLSEEPVTITYVRGADTFNAEIVPKMESNSYSTGFSYNLYREKTGVFGVIKYSLIEVKYWIQVTFKNLGMLISGKFSANDISGVVGIVDMIGDSYEETKAAGNALDVLLQMMYICILLSANLGVMNLLPIPALDGGRFLLLLVEAVIRKPLNRKVEGIVNLVGFGLLMLLMVVVFFNDIRRLFF
ncbi:MAG: RIP metalloprotease RseP [Lachnospiraceae bacterium]|nr:RIP metalloprotease RseP [Lachnospiraceae bacterium]